MTLDLNRYRSVIKPIVQAFLDRNQAGTKVPDAELIGVIAVATNCPIVAVGYYVGELSGFTGELTAQIARLEAFYKLDAVEGKL